MRKILLFVTASALIASLASSSVLGAAGEKPIPKQVIVEALLLCRSQVLIQDGKAIGLHLQACAFVQPNASHPIHNASNNA